MDERKLVELCRQGDDAALKELYGTLAPRMISICRRYAGPEKAEDIFQDGFIDILDGLDKFTWLGEGSLSAWASKVMTNRALMHLRGNRAEIRLESVETAAEPAPEEIPKVPAEVLRGFINDMPARYRSVFILRVFEEMSHTEIARRLGIKERSSSSQFFHARQYLAKKINEYIRENHETDK